MKIFASSTAGITAFSCCFLVALVSWPFTVRARNSLARTPPMGWMSWELFRCDVDCVDSPDMCISEKLYRAQTDALVDGGYLKAGYEGIHLDDCWEEKYPPRDKNTGMLQPNASRFPSGMKSLGDYMHSKKVKFGLYTAESPSTCGGYPASAPYHEKLDAKTFASWGVDYLKVDGCGPTEYYKGGYKAMGEALEESGRNIVYSCSWPAYINNGNETLQPFGEFINDGCNLWRNWHDIQCNWDSLGSIIDHWGDYGPSLVPFAGPGHWHDMDQLLVGAHCVTEEEERTNMAIWCISATPLIMGNDLRNVSAASKAILLNTDAIAVNQDPLGQMGMRLTKTAVEPAQVWYRNLANGDVAVALYNKDNGAPIEPPFDNSTANCEAKDTWIETEGGYYEACGGSEGDIGSFTRKTLAEAKTSCCANKDCAGFSFDKNGDGFFKKNANCGMTKSSAYTGYTRASAIPSQPTPNARDITVTFADLHLYGPVEVYDIWAQKMVGTFTDGSYTAKEVAHHDTAFLRLSSGAEDDNN